MAETNYTYRKEKKSTKSYQNYPISYIVWLILGIIVFVITALISHHNQLKGFEARIFYDINNLPNYWDTLALIVTYGLVYVAIPICVIVPLLFKKYRLAWRFFFITGGSVVVMEIAKRIVREPRPVVLLHGHLHARLAAKGLTSFPSGHQTAATAMALILCLILPRRWWWLAAVWIIAVGLSRIYLGVHTPLDVIGGFSLGLISVCVIRLLPRPLAKKLRLDLDTPLI